MHRARGRITGKLLGSGSPLPQDRWSYISRCRAFGYHFDSRVYRKWKVVLLFGSGERYYRVTRPRVEA